MNVMQVVVGITYSLLSILLTPIYIRVIYIFISRSKYRCYECYRIMIQIGIVQCLMAPGIFFVGVTHLHGEDPFSLASSTMKLMTVGVGSYVNFNIHISFILSP
ncbi:hypothetical protein QR680_010052 [Steinernema hermaphroditum]|uniref:7TM GPCR serpentine receptor class x (Srx) domain-containing protein n=1 Tax=Steinernema hermaphroditum TaxID=289476 RepID=A0AA39MAU5_9BILA|nr:hypothetical protein QR680_010052 [Steinernema hermaphroditum]